MERRRYKNPPIEEALIEFRFEPSQDWDFTMLGRFHSELLEDYPGKPRQQNVVEASFTTQNGTTPNFAMREGFGKVQLVTSDESRIVAIGPDVLSVHMLAPYQQEPEPSGWDEFRPRSAAALRAYWSAAEPRGVRQIGLRYINKISIPGASNRVAQYLTTASPNVVGLPEQVVGFVRRAEYVYPDDVRLIVTHATVDAPEEHTAFIIDIDVIWQSEKAVDVETALKEADKLREREREVFEALITDEARSLFDA